MISEDDFVSGIKFLVENGIINISVSGGFGGITTDTQYVTTDALAILNSDPVTSTIGKQGYTYGFKAVPTFNTEVNSSNVCGLSLCTKELTMEQRIQYYLLARGLN